MDGMRSANSIATADAWRQGDIAGLDDSMPRRLVASAAHTERNGGDLAITNGQGHVGRHQAGDGWLVDASLIDQAGPADQARADRRRRIRRGPCATA